MFFLVRNISDIYDRNSTDWIKKFCFFHSKSEEKTLKSQVFFLAGDDSSTSDSSTVEHSVHALSTYVFFYRESIEKYKIRRWRCDRGCTPEFAFSDLNRALRPPPGVHLDVLTQSQSLSIIRETNHITVWPLT